MHDQRDARRAAPIVTLVCAVLLWTGCELGPRDQTATASPALPTALDGLPGESAERSAGERGALAITPPPKDEPHAVDVTKMEANEDVLRLQVLVEQQPKKSDGTAGRAPKPRLRGHIKSAFESYGSDSIVP